MQFEIIECLAGSSIAERVERFKSEICGKHKKIIIGCKTEGIADGISRMIAEYGIKTRFIHNVAELEVQDDGIYTGIMEFSEGFACAEFAIIPEFYITGEEFLSSISKKNTKRATNIVKLKVQANSFQNGDLVVHKEHGISIFEELVIIEHAGKKCETAKLLYKGGDVLYIPIYHIDSISKYSSDAEISHEEKLKLLDKLGGKSFLGRKQRVKERLFEIAGKLVETAAARKTSYGKSFVTIPGVTEGFYNNFPYILTADQEQAISDIEQDLSSGNIMDRLICGDVGFGKTEVAMRAAFLVCQGRGFSKLSGKTMPEYLNKYKEIIDSHQFDQVFLNYGQVAIIVPTTILARQHFNNFTERFKGTGVVIREISRNKSNSEKDQILMELEYGDVDIIIGTHALFADRVKFHNLQLLIIDEEQHFGVKQKEKLKETYLGIHYISLSATPIPRTLQMSLAGVRDMSIIATPPFDRILPKTFLMSYDKVTIAHAIERELARNGRVFFVCPRISDLAEQRQILEELHPKAKIAIANGQMSGEKLDDVMIKFYEGDYNILVTTSIIESGVDISFANTMFIYNANLFGISQLYQLRGRIGRSNLQGYCYFLANESVRGTKSSLRLKTLANLKSLGAGFMVATSDLDIRGAGNLVGEQQSGQIKDVGVELFQEMLAETIQRVKSGQTLEAADENSSDLIPEIKIGISIFIPHDYIADISIRMEFYRRIAAVMLDDELRLLTEELVDRFGQIPESLDNLFKMTKLKIRCKTLGITKLEVGPKGTVIAILPAYSNTVNKAFDLIPKNPKNITIRPDNTVFFINESIDFVKKAQDTIAMIS